MLFNSFEFVFGFLPLTVIGFFLVARRGSRPLAVGEPETDFLELGCKK